MKDPLLGTRLPRNYLITGKLGRGAMSMVYQGVYEPLDQPVAIKLLKSHLVSDLQSFKRFQQEAKTAGALEHRNIVSIFDFGVTDQGVPYLIMELVIGESLLGLLRQTRWLSVDAALRIFIQTADALAYTHSRGVIHRDIKPSNILVTSDEEGNNNVKIVDFGIAKVQDYQGNPGLNLTQTGEVFGTPLYISPEQAMARPLDARADIYSLGCVMYEAIAGRPPFNANAAFDVLRLQCTEMAPPLGAFRRESELPPHLVLSIGRCMEKDPSARYQCMEELAIDLQRAEIEHKIAIDADSDRLSLTRSKVTPIEGLKNYSQQVLESSRAAPAPAYTPHLPWPAISGPAGISQPPTPRPAQSFSGSVSVRQAGSLAARAAASVRPRPWLAFTTSIAAGCLAGLLILAVSHFTASGHSFAKKSAQQLENEQVRPQGQSSMLDAPTTEMREQALSLYDEGKFGEAEVEINKALSLARDKKDTLGAGLLLADLCMIDISLRKLPDAFEAGTSAVKILDGKPQVADKDLAFALRGLGTVSFYRGDLAKAEHLLKRSTQLDKVVYGPNDERFAIGIARLAKVLEDEKKFDEAESNYREALDVSRTCHQPGDQHLEMRLKGLAAFLRKRHHNAEALFLERQARELQQKESSS